jgi:parvulin-like peptidyl-prolyl isomerase
VNAAPTSAAPTDSDDPIVARLNAINIRRSQIITPLLEGYGTNVLINVTTLELAKQEAAQRKLTVTQQDIDAEHDQTLAKLFGDAKKEDYPQLLEQFLQQQRISRPEFDIWLQTNAYLREIAEPMVKSSITEERLQESFKALYGETVLVRYIECANLQEIAEAKRRLAAGETFEHVAQTMSRNGRTAQAGGLLPPFSRYAEYPEVFKDVAFSLKPGEVSDTVEANGVFSIIKLEKKMEPKAIKYDDVKESLKQDLSDRLTQSQIKNFRSQLVDRIAAGMTVSDPILAKQYELKKSQSDSTVHGKKEALDAIKRDERRAADLSEQGPLQPEDLRPPATMPGAAAPGATTVPSIPKPTTHP